MASHQPAVALATARMAEAEAISVPAASVAGFVAIGTRFAIIQRIALAFAAVSIAIGTIFVANDAHSDGPPPASVDVPRAVRSRQPEELENDRTVQIEAVSRADGSPLAGAAVWVRTARGRIRTWEGMTDDQGRYKFVVPGQATTQYDVVVAHAGHVTGWATVVPLASYTMPLERSGTIGGIVRDEVGRPIEGARVLPTYAQLNVPWPEIYASPNSSLAVATTDAQGRWRADALWDNAGPDAALGILVTHPDHITTQLQTTAEKARTFSIEQFTLVHGSGPALPGMRPIWIGDRPTTFTSGQFDLSSGLSPDDHSRQSILIEANGYQPVERLGFLSNSEDVACDFKLRKATPFSGIVRGPDGQPLAGADVALGDTGNSVPLYYYWVGTPLNVFPSTRTRTDGTGRYSLPFRDRRAWIVVAHKSGFALRSPDQLAASTEITVVPWGRIEGVVRIGTRSASSHRVGARLSDRRLFDGVVEHTTRTDRDGRFTIENVAPGVLTVGRQVRDADGGGYTLSNSVDVEVAPGQTVRVEIGGPGRPVIGRFALTEGAVMINLASSRVRMRSRPPVLRMPAGFMNFTDEQWFLWWDGFHQSPEGWAYLEGDRQFAVAIRPDGTFRIEDVPSGRYVLKLSFCTSVGDDSSRRLAFARADVEVPTIPGGRSDVLLDIGLIPLEAFPFRELNVGDRVPDNLPKAADGRTLELAALRGKVVLLAFWSTRWSIASLPHLKKTYDAFGGNPRFVMIGLNEDFAPEAMHWCVARHNLTWEQRYLGSSDDPNPIAAAFGVRFLPAGFLIGPDGRVIAKNLEGDRIKQAVAASLSKWP